ncbi:MAG: ABC transporter ATP-binding protein [Desulfobacteraceae bacterium]|nr:ABC transporter ATP-binding protein [Desulfobacteraceae bacterium]
MLKLKNVTKKFGELIAVNNLSFQVEKGRIFGIAGPNGAGKSTVYNLITGMYSCLGRIEFEGHDITGAPPHKIARLGISRTFQIPHIFPSMSVEQSIGVGNRFGAGGRYEPGYVNNIISILNLETVRHQGAGELNLLGKKKLMMGAALATRPKILLLDEPMAGSNTTEIMALMELIRKINKDMGISIIIIEHFMKVLTELTDTLLIIEAGTEICCGDPEKVTSNPIVIETYLGEAYAQSNQS